MAYLVHPFAHDGYRPFRANLLLLGYAAVSSE
jgi:hypothetical protein